MMRPNLPSTRRTALTAAILVIACLGGVGGALAAPIPDLLDLPAPVNARAVRSLQLAVTRAGDRLVAVGEHGTVLLSDDNGRNWRQARRVPVSVALTDVHFPTAQLGWAVGHSGVVLHSADGGETWARQLDGKLAAQVVVEDARKRAGESEGGNLDAGNRDAAARRLRDAEGLVADGPDKPFLGVHFADESRGWVVGAYGLALATKDGGKSWTSLMGTIPNPRGKHLYQVRGDANALLVAGEQGALFRSTDGGSAFSALATPYAGTWFGALRTRSDTLLAFGLRGNAWRSADGGASWERIDAGQPVTLAAGRTLADDSIILGDASGRLLRSTDGGRSLVALTVAPTSGLTGLVQAADGALILSGPRGLTRIEPELLVAEVKK
ncbi:YCF48-related protein [Aromatoleum toluolicum]|uniref:Photosynthesis system II assembly factor Ycf48/Hcf136-like domain-containing protein n=1 Tax=Aromatoleum toluolicum TaxID=90060 RepID=A0ABX1NIQ4_9RHOO|nr:YCF48-related protein [Aromatoleum toluolicum]NMF99109.1 YCF48-related protein [Aromatoleum toluolicum]